MAAQHLNAWSPAILTVAAQALIDALTTTAGAGSVTIHASDDTLLATVPLDDPAGDIDANGVADLTPTARDEDAAASGTASYASIRDGDGTVHRSMPCEAGSDPVAGKCVLNTITIVAGGPVEINSLSVG